MSPQNAGNTCKPHLHKETERSGNADDGALCFGSGIFKFVLFISHMSELLDPTHHVKANLNDQALWDANKMPIYALTAFFFILFPLGVSSTIFRYASLFSAGEVKDKTQKLCCSIQSLRCLMRSGGYWAPGVCSINPNFVHALAPYRISTYQFACEIWHAWLVWMPEKIFAHFHLSSKKLQNNAEDLRLVLFKHNYHLFLSIKNKAYHPCYAYVC